MSKIGKKIIEVPQGITVTDEPRSLIFKNAKASLTVPKLHGVKVIIEENKIHFELSENSKQAKSSWGTTASLCFNAIEGLTKGYSKKLILEGVGFRVIKEGDNLNLSLGFSHPIHYKALPGISFEVEKNSALTISGVDKALVGQVAAEIRSMKKPEPYKGKGFRYHNEVIRRKAGKKSGS